MVVYPTGGDDTASINNALLSSRTVYLIGLFTISAPIVLAESGNNLIGDGIATTRITANRAAGDAFTTILNYRAKFGGSGSGSYRLEGFSIYANGHSLTTLTESDNTKYAWGIYLLTAHYSVIRNVHVYDTGLRGIGAQTSRNVLVDSCHIENAGYIAFPNQSDLLWQIKADGNGVALNSCIDSGIVNCTSKNVRDCHFTLWQCLDSKIENCFGDTNMVGVENSINTRAAFTIESTANNCSILDCMAANIIGSVVQVSSKHSTVKNISIINHTGLTVATSTDIHNSHFENITSTGSNGMLIGQASDSANNINVTLLNCSPLGVTGANTYGIQLNKIVSGFAKGCVVSMDDTSQGGIGFFGNAANGSFILDANDISGESNYGYEIRNTASGVVIQNSIVNGTKNAAVGLFTTTGTVIEGNLVQQDAVSGQLPYMTVRMDSATPSSGCIIKNNTLKDFTRQVTLGIYDQNNASNPTLINNTSG